MKTIAELRNDTDDIVGLPEAYYPLCMAGKLVAKRQLLVAELEDLPEPPAADKPAPPRTISTVDPRVAKEAEIAKVDEQMAEHLSPVLLRAKPPTVWIAWEAAHPPRDDNDDDIKADCNFDQLIESLPEHIVTVGGDALKAGDWEWMVETASLGDLREMAWLVTRLQYAGVAVPKSRTGSSGAQTRSASSR